MTAISVAKYPHPIELPSDYEMPFRPRAGQFLFYVEIEKTENPPATLKLLESLDYELQLRYATFPNGESVLCALLRYEQHDPSQGVSDEYLLSEWQRLCNQIEPTEAVHSMRGAARKPQLIAS